MSVSDGNKTEARDNNLEYISLFTGLTFRLRRRPTISVFLARHAKHFVSSFRFFLQYYLNFTLKTR